MIPTREEEVPVFSVYCELDVGQDGLVFETEELAERWIENNFVLDDYVRLYQKCRGDLRSDGLLGVRRLTLVRSSLDDGDDES